MYRYSVRERTINILLKFLIHDFPFLVVCLVTLSKFCCKNFNPDSSSLFPSYTYKCGNEYVHLIIILTPNGFCYESVSA